MQIMYILIKMPIYFTFIQVNSANQATYDLINVVMVFLHSFANQFDSTLFTKFSILILIGTGFEFQINGGELALCARQNYSDKQLFL